MRSQFIAILLVALTHGIIAQTPPAFDVASIKRSDATFGSRMQLLPGGRLKATAWTKPLIETAYGVENSQVSGGPEWIRTDRYELDARAGSETAGRAEMTLMLKSLLTERFNLRLHEEQRDVPVYDLVVDKNGHKLRALKDGEPPPCRRGDSFVCGLTTMTDLARWLTALRALLASRPGASAR
jgi:uncharacterized protein (TIGR03435 family)